jgi:hypothetical protein
MGPICLFPQRHSCLEVGGIESGLNIDGGNTKLAAVGSDRSLPVKVMNMWVLSARHFVHGHDSKLNEEIEFFSFCSINHQDNFVKLLRRRISGRSGSKSCPFFVDVLQKFKSGNMRIINRPTKALLAVRIQNACGNDIYATISAKCNCALSTHLA